MVYDKDRSGMDLSPSIPSMLSSPPSSLPIILLNAQSSCTPLRTPLIYQPPNVPTLQSFIERKEYCTFIERACGPTSCVAHHHLLYDLDQQPHVHIR